MNRFLCNVQMMHVQFYLTYKISGLRKDTIKEFLGSAKLDAVKYALSKQGSVKIAAVKQAAVKLVAVKLIDSN